MKKGIIKKLSILMMGVVVMTSCADKVKIYEYTNAIPADASLVIELKVQSLLDKSGAGDEQKKYVADFFKNALSDSSFSQVENILKDGSESGISIKSPVYIFANDELDTPVAVAHVTDMDKLIKTLEVLADENLVDPIENKNGFKLVKINDNGFLAFNNTTLLFGERYRNADTSAVTDLLKQDKEQSMANNAYFQSMVKLKGDVSCYVTMNAFGSDNPFGFATTLIDPKEVGIIASLNFEKGKALLQGELVTDNKLLKGLLKNQDQACGKLSEAFIHRFPASTLMFGALNVNGEKLFDFLQGTEGVSGELTNEEVAEVKKAFSSFDGDIAVGLTDVTMSDVPSFVAYSEAKNGAILDAVYEYKDIFEFSRGEDIVKLSANEYMYKSRQINVYFGYKDNYMYATNSKLTLNNIGKKADKSIKDARYASNMKGKKQYLVVDVDAILALPMVKMAAALGSRDITSRINMAKKVSYAEYFSEGNNKFAVNIWLSNKDDNSLKQMIDWITGNGL